MIRQIKDVARRHVWCEHWRANFALVIVTSVCTAWAMRFLIAVYAVIMPENSYAAALAQAALDMSRSSFYLTAAIATLGGATSLLHELRQSPQSFSILMAVGHMFAAQFAGLLVFLLGVEWGFSTPFALASCGVAGWGGNKTITLINDRIINKVFPDGSRGPQA